MRIEFDEEKKREKIIKEYQAVHNYAPSEEYIQEELQEEYEYLCMMHNPNAYYGVGY